MPEQNLQHAFKVCIVEDHPVTAEGMKQCLTGALKLKSLTHATSGLQAIAIVESVPPDLVFLGLDLPDTSGLEILRRLKALPNPPAVVIFTASDSELYFLEALRWGVDGYLLKSDSLELLEMAVQVCSLGGRLFSSVLLPVLFSQQASVEALGFGEKGPISLTPREIDILTLAAQGAPNVHIGEELHLATATVKKHFQSINRKFGVKNRTESILTAVRLGLV